MATPPSVRIVILVVASCCVSTAWAQGAEGRDRASGLQFGVQTELTVTDNVGLTPSGTEQGGSIYEISPYVGYASNSRRLQGRIEYGLRYIYNRNETKSNNLTHDLNGAMTLALNDSGLWLDATAQTTQISSSPFLTSSADPARRDENRSRYTSYSISPYQAGNLGRNTTYRVAYTYSRIGISRVAPSTITHQVAGDLVRDPDTGHFGWQSSVESNRYGFSNTDTTFTGTTALVELLYRYSYAFRVGAGARYDRNEAVANDQGDRSGISPTVSAVWTPSPRTRGEITASRPYYGSENALSLSHRSGRVTYGIEHTQGLSVGANSVFRTTDETDRVTIGSGVVRGPVARNRRTTAFWAWSSARHTAKLSFGTGRSNTQTTLIGLPDNNSGFANLKQTTYGASLERRLSPSNSIGISLERVESEAPQSNESAELTSWTLFWARQIGKRSNLRVSYQNNRQTNIDASNRYKENALIATYNLRF